MVRKMLDCLSFSIGNTFLFYLHNMGFGKFWKKYYRNLREHWFQEIRLNIILPKLCLVLWCIIDIDYLLQCVGFQVSSEVNVISCLLCGSACSFECVHIYCMLYASLLSVCIYAQCELVEHPIKFTIVSLLTRITESIHVVICTTSHLSESKLIRVENQQAAFWKTLLVKRIASIWNYKLLKWFFLWYITLFSKFVWKNQTKHTHTTGIWIYSTNEFYVHLNQTLTLLILVQNQLILAKWSCENQMWFKLRQK